MKALILSALIATAFLGAPDHREHGRCSGGAFCTACSNCNYCKHCAEEGGTCSVCHPEQYEPGAPSSTVHPNTTKPKKIAHSSKKQPSKRRKAHG